MTVLDVYQCFMLTSFNLQKDRMIVILSWSSQLMFEWGWGCNCFSWRWFSLERMTVQSRYVNQEKLKGSLLIPSRFHQPPFQKLISWLCINTVGSQLCRKWSLYKTCDWSNKHFKHGNCMWKKEILRKSLTVNGFTRKTKGGRIKENRCS